MMYGNRQSTNVGVFCHWCGEYVGTKTGFRAGNHLFCDNAGKCKMAHFRAFKKYKPRVTAGAAGEPGQVARSGPGGNGNESKRIPTSSGSDRVRIQKGGNARKGRK
jgi:hypothetical protein